MKVVIAGQKWLGAEVLGMCRDLGHHVVQAVVPSPDDRLAVAASAAGVPVTVEARRVDTVTPSDILIAAHCHAFITPRARATAAVAWLRRQIGIINNMPSAPKKIPEWRTARYRAINARAKEFEGGVERYRAYALERFGSSSLRSLDDEQLNAVYQHVFAWR